MNELGFIPVTLVPIFWIVAAYLIGSISFGIIFSKLFGLPDPRTVGSGNIGATNIARSGKKLPAILTLLGDAFKGWLPVWLALQTDMLMWVVAAVGLVYRKALKATVSAAHVALSVASKGALLASAQRNQQLEIGRAHV